MAISNIQEKLRKILQKDSFGEVEIVYILSRIRKLLEIDAKEKEYKKLKFFCDWALHKQIDNTDPVNEDLKNFDDILVSYKFLQYELFDKEFKKLLKEYGIETTIYQSLKSILEFHQLLSEIYSDTPIIIKTIKRRKITIKKGELQAVNVGGMKVYVSPIEFTVIDD